MSAAGAPRAVLFDVGDTLIRRPTVGPGRRIVEALGLGPDQARAITRLVFTTSCESPGALAARLRRDLALERAVDEEIAAIWRAQESEPVEVPGATACVRAARAAGARIGIVSNIWRPYETGFRRACPAIPPLVDVWRLSYREGVAKPDPALFRGALAALAVPPERAVMVGDSLEKDVLPAVALGMRAIWVVAPTEDSAGARTPAAALGGADGGGPTEVGAPEARAAVPPGCALARDLGEVRALVLAALGMENPSAAG